MWIFSQFGFYSIVIDRRRPGSHVIRARFERDLENLMNVCGLAGGIHFIIGTDYQYRISIPSTALPEILATLGRNVDYPNFKERIAATLDQANKSAAYHNVWATMANLSHAEQP